MSSARVNDVTASRDAVIAKCRSAKADVIAILEGGHRDWPELRATLERYIDFQTAADVLGGMTKLEGG